MAKAESLAKAQARNRLKTENADLRAKLEAAEGRIERALDELRCVSAEEAVQRALAILSEPANAGGIASSAEADVSWCRDCGASMADRLDFHVGTSSWNATMDPTGSIREEIGDPVPREGVPGVVCLACFDRRAESARVDYSGDLAIMGRSCWMATGEAISAVGRHMGIEEHRTLAAPSAEAGEPGVTPPAFEPPVRTANTSWEPSPTGGGAEPHG